MVAGARLRGWRGTVHGPLMRADGDDGAADKTGLRLAEFTLFGDAPAS